MIHDLKERFNQENEQILIEASSQYEKDINKTVNETNRAIEEIVYSSYSHNDQVAMNYHTGGITGYGQMPTLHVGGLASQFMNAPLHNEIDVRLLQNETILTGAQQANLMRIIDAGFTSKLPDLVETINNVLPPIHEIK